MTTTQSQIIRVRVCPIYSDGLTRIDRLLKNHGSVLKMHQQYVEELLVQQFRVKIMKSINVYYNNDPYAHTDERSQYIFVDFEWLPNTDQTVTELRHQLLATNVIMEFHKIHHIRIEIQDKHLNVLRDSTSSILNYHSNGVPITGELMEELIAVNEPFTGEEQEPPLGYRDAYVNFV